MCTNAHTNHKACLVKIHILLNFQDKCLVLSGDYKIMNKLLQLCCLVEKNIYYVQLRLVKMFLLGR